MEAAVGILAQIGAFLGGGKRELHVAHPERGGRAAHEGPDERVRVAQQAGGLDASVEQLSGLGQLAALAPDSAQRRNQEEEELALAGSACQGQRAIGVRVGLGVPVEIELDPGEPGGGLEVARELVVRQRIHQRRRL